MSNLIIPMQHSLIILDRALIASRASSGCKKNIELHAIVAITRKSRRAEYLRGLASCAALAFVSVAGSQASAQTSVVGACTGVSLPRSVVTNLIGSVLVPVLTPAQTLLSPLTGGLLNLNITPTLTSTAAGAPITLNALDINGNAITAAGAGQCVQQADGFQLTTPAGLSLGGGRITGLGSGAIYANAAELDSIAFGNGANTAAGATGAIALGTGASVAAGAPGSVALGQNSRATGATLGNGAYLIGGTAAAEVNIGDRRLTGLAGGSADTDAVNVAQLKQATLGLNPVDTLVFDTATNAFSATHSGAATRITNVADGTIAAGSTDAVNGGQLAITNAEVTANTTTINSVGTAVTGLQSNALLYDPAANAFNAARGGAATKIVNVAAATLSATSADAVNGAQLFATNQQVGTNTTDISNLTTNIANGTADPLAVRYTDAAKGTLALGGTNGTVLTNVTAGAVNPNSTDAVNGAQLSATNDAVTTNGTNITNVGGAVAGLQANALLYNPAINAFDATRNNAPGTITNVAAGALNGTSSDAVNGAQLFATNTRVDVNTTNIANLTTSIAAGTADPLAVRYADATKGTLALGGANGSVVTNVAAGAVSGTSTDAVNGAQLSATNDAVAGNTANITTIGGSVSTLNTSVAALQTDALQYDVGLQAFNAARGGTAQRITNIAAGTLSPTSSDAVNGAQVYGFGGSVAAALGGTSSYNPVTGQVNAGIIYGGTTYGDVQGAVSAIETSIGGTAGTNQMYFNANSTMADSQAMGADSTAIGPAAMAAANGSLAAGRNTMAMSAGSVAIGDGSAAMTGKAVAIGSANLASGDGAVAIGDPNIATGDGAIALGRDNQATGIGAVALGDTNFATGDSSVSIGGNNSAVGAGAVAIGNVNVVNGVNALAIGTGNRLNGLQAIAIGNNNRVTGDQSLGFGNNIIATGVDTLAVGNDTIASGDSSAAYGNRAAATGIGSTAIGTASTANAQYGVALGDNAAATAVASTALGTGAVASSLGSVAVGTGALASAENSVALGGAASTTRGGVTGYTAFGVAPAQTSLGEVAVGVTLVYTNPLTGLPTATGARQITGVAAGSEDTDAVNVAQLRGVSSTLGTAYATGLGGGATYNSATGAVTGPAYVINGTTYNNVGDALAGVSGAVGQVANTAVSYDTASKDKVTLGGATGTTITNVAAGALTANSTDAVNGAQLAATNQTVTNLGASTAASLGGGVVVNPDGSVSAPTYQVATVAAGGASAAATYNDVGTALAGLGTSIVNVNSRIDTINTISDRAVTYDGAAGTSRDTITLAGTNGTRLTNVAAGAVNATSTDAVNGAQLNAVGQQVATNTTNITNLQNGTTGMFQVNNTAAAPAPVASGTNAVAGGSGAVSSGASAIALGTAANATAANSVALGAGSVADRANSVSVGTAAASRQITNVAAGVSAGDAVNVGQLNTGLNQTLAQANAYTDTRLNQLGFDLKDVRRDANGGTAAAMALATIPQAYGPGMGMVGGGISNWGGEEAFAVGVSKANADGTFVVKAGATVNTRGKGGGAVGAGFAF